MNRWIKRAFALMVVTAGFVLLLNKPAYALPACSAQYTFYSDNTFSSIIGTRTLYCSGGSWNDVGSKSNYYWLDCGDCYGACDCGGNSYRCENGTVTAVVGTYYYVGMPCTRWVP